MSARTYALDLPGGMVHRIISVGSESGFTTKCAVKLPRTATYVDVHYPKGKPVCGRGFLCAGCFGEYFK